MNTFVIIYCYVVGCPNDANCFTSFHTNKRYSSSNKVAQFNDNFKNVGNSLTGNANITKTGELIKCKELNPETSVLKQPTLRNNPEDGRIELNTCSSASQEIPCILWKPKVLTAFARARHLYPFSARSIHCRSPILYLEDPFFELR